MLSRLTEAAVTEKLSRKHLADPAARHKDELSWLCERHQIRTVLQVPDAAAPIDVVADLARRTVDVGMTLRAPEDKKTSKARINWLLRQIKAEDVEHVYVRLNWAGLAALLRSSVSLSCAPIRELLRTIKAGFKLQASTCSRQKDLERDSHSKRIYCRLRSYRARVLLQGWRWPVCLEKKPTSDKATS